MKSILIFFLAIFAFSCSRKPAKEIEIPFSLDHNRMLVSAEMQRQDGSWRNVLLWVDTGNPDFFVTPQLALDLGIITGADSIKSTNGVYQGSEIPNVRLKNFNLDFSGVKPNIIYSPFWLFASTGADANLPSTVLKNYDVVFDYPSGHMRLSEKGFGQFAGLAVPAGINPETGIVQIDGIFENDSLSFAIDIGASFTFASVEFLEKLQRYYPDQPYCMGAVGYANIWGWGYKEDQSVVTRIPEIKFGTECIKGLGVNIPPDFNDEGIGMMDWYSQKTLKPIDGFLGPNAFRGYCLGLDYLNSKVYLEKKVENARDDFNMVGLTVRLEKDGNYRVVGIARVGGMPVVEGVNAGDILTGIDDFNVNAKSMGEVVEKLRGNPGEYKNLKLERDGRTLVITARVIKII